MWVLLYPQPYTNLTPAAPILSYKIGPGQEKFSIYFLLVAEKPQKIVIQ
jgi:hypothetical protein